MATRKTASAKSGKRATAATFSPVHGGLGRPQTVAQGRVPGFGLGAPAGRQSKPFAAGEHGPVAVEVIDDLGNELLVVKKLAEAEK